MPGPVVQVRAVIKTTKPAIILLLAFTAIAAAIVAYGGISVFTWRPFLFCLVAVVLGSAGSEAMTAFTDRDIDKIMRRTENRPVPSGLLVATVPLFFGLALVVIASLFAFLVGLLVVALLWIAIADNVLVYSVWLKRRSRWNVIAGGVCGGVPVLMAWASVTGELSITSFFLAAVVIVWIPLHIWSFSLEYREDYERAAIPMYPLTISGPRSFLAVGSAGLVLTMFSFLAYVAGVKSYVLLATSLLMGMIVVALSVALIFNPTKRNAERVFVFSNIYLLGFFLAIMLPYI